MIVERDYSRRSDIAVGCAVVALGIETSSVHVQYASLTCRAGLHAKDAIELWQMPTGGCRMLQMVANGGSGDV